MLSFVCMGNLCERMANGRKPHDGSQRPNEAGSAQPALHGLYDEAVTRSHESQSKSDTFMPVIWIAGNLFSCSKQICKIIVDLPSARAMYNAPPPINMAALICCLKATFAVLIW